MALVEIVLGSAFSERIMGRLLTMMLTVSLSVPPSPSATTQETVYVPVAAGAVQLTAAPVPVIVPLAGFHS